jgi:acyl-coenzyme A synthetase/AMP-(fatty) acid ligase
LPALIPCPVHENARQRPQADAIRWAAGGRTISWQMLTHYVSATVRHLKEFGLRPGDRVILAAGFDPSFVIVVFSLWRMGASICVLDQGMDDPEFFKAAELLCPALMIVGRKRRSKVKQLLIEEAAALEEVKNFWYGSEDVGPQIDPQVEALAFVKDGQLVSVPFDDLLAGRFTPGELFVERIMHGLRSGQTILV